MGAQTRIYRQRIKSVQSTKKITKAMELIAASRVIKARKRAQEAAPYTRALTRAVSAVAAHSREDHPLTTESPNPKRAAVVIITADRGQAGAYSVTAIKEGQELIERLTREGKETVSYLAGRKGIGYYKFRRRDFAESWDGFSDAPEFEHAEAIANRILEDFAKDEAEGGVDEVHIVYTLFKSMVSQEARVLRLLPLEVVEGDAEDDSLEAEMDAALMERSEKVKDGHMLPQYAFEPTADEVLDALLPKYVRNRIFTCLLSSAASELAQRQRAMKSATDNAEELIKKYTRLANQARQAGITQEISEIVGGAAALAES